MHVEAWQLVILTGPSRIVKGFERGVQTASQVGEFPCTYGSLDSPSVDVDSLTPTASPLPDVPFYFRMKHSTSTTEEIGQSWETE